MYRICYGHFDIFQHFPALVSRFERRDFLPRTHIGRGHDDKTRIHVHRRRRSQSHLLSSSSQTALAEKNRIDSLKSPLRPFLIRPFHRGLGAAPRIRLRSPATSFVVLVRLRICCICCGLPSRPAPPPPPPRLQPTLPIAAYHGSSTGSRQSACPSAVIGPRLYAVEFRLRVLPSAGLASR